MILLNILFKNLFQTMKNKDYPLFYSLIVSSFLFLSCSYEDKLLTSVQARKYIIAHRGSYQLHALPENSRASFREALALHIFGTEFDVRQTADGVLVINHDDYFNDKKVTETTFKELLDYKLSNGETIPTLIDFFDIYKETSRRVKLIIELKNCDVESVVDLVNEYEIQDDVRYISFNKEYCNQLVQQGLGKYVLYLYSELSPNEVKNLGYGWICYHESVYNLHLEWLKEAKDMNLIPCALWPVNDIGQMEMYSNLGILFFTDMPMSYSD